MSDLPYECLLAIALPAALEEEVLDHLAAHPQWVGGYTVLQAEGLGRGARLGSSMEKVRGRSRRRMVQILMRNENVQPLIESLQRVFHTPEMAWWTTPIGAFGRFA